MPRDWSLQVQASEDRGNLVQARQAPESVTVSQHLTSNGYDVLMAEGEVRVDDDELLRRCRQGDDSALELLVERFQARIFRLACRILGDAARAEEAAVDALAIVWRRCHTWRGDSGAATWIHRVAWRVILDHQRARRRWWRFWELDGSEDVPASISEEPSRAAVAREAHERLACRLSQALRELSSEDRGLIHLHYYDGLPLKEVAEILNVSRDALKMRLSRIRGKLRPLLGEEHDNG